MYRKHLLAIILILIAALLITIVFSLKIGQFAMPLESIVAIIGSQLGIVSTEKLAFTPEQQAVLWYIRMPRMLVGMLVGAALGTTGAVMQGLFSNPLADPGIIGVSSGAATGAVLSIALGLTGYGIFYMPAFAFAGSLLAIIITVFLAMRHGKIPVLTLMLSGVAVGMLLAAITSATLTMISEQQLQQYMFWMVGGLDYRRWEHVLLAFYPITIGILILCVMARQLNILALGETEARAVGMNVMPMRLFLLLVASLTTATAVCVSGNIGFIGLVIPHVMRMLVGPDHRVLLPTSAIAGAVFLLLCDTLGRAIMPPAEIRVGIMTALLGTPYFLYLLRKINK